MSAKKYTDSFIVINEKGLHTRPSTELVKCASAFKSRVSLHFQDSQRQCKIAPWHPDARSSPRI